jgi:hypothetical protein
MTLELRGWAYGITDGDYNAEEKMFYNYDTE